MGFRALRVINDDRIAPGRGFGTHPHRDMEIFSYVLEGALEHKDSLGNGSILKPGDIQLMSAGTGVSHSEFNPSSTEEGHFLQIWILPNQRGLKPSYTEWRPSDEQRKQPKVLVIAPDGRDGSATIHQDARIYRIKLRAGESVSHELEPGRGLWLQIARGSADASGQALNTGDGLAVETPGSVTISSNNEVEALLMDFA